MTEKEELVFELSGELLHLPSATCHSLPVGATGGFTGSGDEPGMTAKR